MQNRSVIAGVLASAGIVGSVMGQADVTPLISQAGADENWNDRGQVYSYQHRPDPTSSYTTKFLGEELGYTGRGLGDVDGDGMSDFAATYYWKTYSSTDPGWEYPTNHIIPAGDVRVFGWDTGTSSIQQIGGVIKYNDALRSGRFAHNIAGHADIDGDEQADVIAGSAIGRGISVWAYTNRFNSGGTGSPVWVQLMRIREPEPYWDHSPSNNLPVTRFGWALDTPKDFNGDGVADLIVGAKGYNEFQPWNRVDDSLDEGAVFVFCMPPYAWWENFEDGGSYYSTYVAPHFPSGVYDGEPLVDIEGDDVDAYYNIRITDPTLTHDANPPTANKIAAEREPSFGTCVRGASDLDGDGSPDLVVSAPAHFGDDERNGKVYVYLSTSHIREEEPTESQFNSLDPFLHEVWEYNHSLGSAPTVTPGANQLDILVGDADLIITGPDLTSGVGSGIAALTNTISEIEPYNDDRTTGDIDLFVTCLSKLDGKTYSGFSAFFQIAKRIQDSIATNGYPDTTSGPILWEITLDETDASDSPTTYPDRYVYSNDGKLQNLDMAGNVDGYGDQSGDQTGQCEVFMFVENSTYAPMKTEILTYNRHRVSGGLIGQFEAIWSIGNEPSSTSMSPCSEDDTVAVSGYPMLTEFEYGLPSGGTASDQNSVDPQPIGKAISRWWWAGDVDGDGLGDLLGAAWFYPSLFESSGTWDCDPVSNGSSPDYFRAGKVFFFQSPFPAEFCSAAQDYDHDGVHDSVDDCISVGDANGDGVLDGTDYSAWNAAWMNHEPAGDADGNGSWDSPADFNAWFYAFNYGCQSQQTCP